MKYLYINCETKHTGHYILECCILHNFVQRRKGPQECVLQRTDKRNDA